MRWIIEGTWTGYRSGQERVCHRRVIKRRDLAEWASKTHDIRYTDGTSLLLTCRLTKPRERVQEIRGYDDLIMDCFYNDVTSVEALIKKRDERKGAVAHSSAELLTRPANHD